MTQVLSDDDLLVHYRNAAGLHAVSGCIGHTAGLRAVEAAVLEKMKHLAPTTKVFGKVLDDAITALRCVPEATARERERAAWDAASEWFFSSWAIRDHDSGTERDKRYPLPTPEPREVRGRDGTRYRWANGQVEYLSNNYKEWKKSGIIATVDAATVAKLLQEKDNA